MASWETIVNDVVIGSNFYALQDASDQYQRLVSALYQLHDSLQSLADNSEGWTGPAADAFRAKVRSMATNTSDLVDSHSKIPQGLGACATALQKAVSTIPIPDWMYQEVSQRQAAYQTRGPLVESFEPGSIMNVLTGAVGRVEASIPLSGEQYKEAEGWVNGNESKAQAAYQALQNAYGREYPNIPAGSPIPGAGVGGVSGAIGGGLRTGAAGAGAFPHPGVGTGFNPPGVGTGGFNPPGTGGIDPGGPDVGSGGFHDPGIGTTLAGVDPAMLNPSGGGGYGSGSGSFSPSGSGSLAASGSGPVGGLGAGRGVPSLGPSVFGPAGAMGLAGMGGTGAMGGAGGARTRSGSSIASGRSGAGVVGGLGARADGDGDDRLTWLQEDDDVWGTNNSAPPGVLS